MSSLTRLTRPVTFTLVQSRNFHASLARHDLVGPPDPVTNLRHVIYDDALPTSAPNPHPYSLKEFTGDTREYQWKVQRQELDSLNHNLWTDSNTRFNAALEAHMSSLPESATPYDKELALSDFYGAWLSQEQNRQQTYNAEWRRRNWDNVVLEARVKYQKLLARAGLGSS